MDTNPGKYRWTVVALLFVATTINYLDRQVISLLKPVLEQEFSWTETDYSRIVLAFSAAYALGLAGFGRIVDQIGVKLGYTLSAVSWSLAAMAHALARSTGGFIAVRALLGLGESGNFPTAIKSVAEWFPKRERALATGIFNAGANIGAVAAPIMVPWLLEVYGWRAAFVVTGAIGFLWVIAWWRYYEHPARQARLSRAEYAYIHQDQADSTEDAAPVNWWLLFRFRQTWAFIAGKFLTDPIWWFFLFWLPSYFTSTFQLDFKKPSLPLVIVYTATTLGSIGGGYLSSWLIRRGWTPFRARKTAMLGFATAVMPIMAARYATDLWVAVTLISLAAAAHQAWSANIYTTASDVFPKKAISSVIGIGGMAGSIGGMLFPLLVGALLDSYKAAGNILAGYNLLFLLSGMAYIIAWGVMHLCTPRMKMVEV
ncbi:MAG: MFS transporter [Bacteroidia bacterium]|nr:MFS transporter [Bacteroidia bacterium]